MKKGYFALGYLLLIVGFGIFCWIERSRQQLEAAAKAADLNVYLKVRSGNEAADFQALSDAGDIENFLLCEGGIFFVVAYTALATLALSAFARTELCAAMMAALSRVWTWRP